MPYAPFEIVEAPRPGAPWLITCDHATNAVPPDVAGGDLGLGPEDMGRHIAYDIGAAGVARHLARHLGAPAVLAGFSRLVIDPNRGEDDPTLIMRLYDGTIIPANRHIGPDETERRLARHYRPYHAALADLAARQAPTAPVTALVAVHSFTPQLRARPPRPWHVGVLFARDDRLARPLLARLRAEPDLCVGENVPYTGYLPGDALDRHASAPGRPGVLIELRNDLIVTEAQQAHWAARLAPLLAAARADAGL